MDVGAADVALLGVDVADRNALSFKRIGFRRVDIRLTDQADFLPPNRDHVHLGRASLGMGMTSDPWLEGVPPKTGRHQGQKKFRYRVRTQGDRFMFHALRIYECR